jgi:hypothetical protein
MTLSTVKGAIFNLVHFIYVGSCYYKPKCLPSHTFSLPSQIFLSVTNSKMCFVYYICNYTTYATVNDTYMWNYLYNLSYVYGVLKKCVCHNFKVEIRDVYIFAIFFNWCSIVKNNCTGL